MLENKNILIMGFGVTGKSSLKFLREFPVKIYIYDKKIDLQSLKVDEDFIIFKDEDLDKIDLIVKSPGIYPFDDLLVKAREKNIEIISDIELSYRYLKTDNVVAVTGTNGKTTTTTIVGDILKRKAKTFVVGNIGRGILEITKEAKKDDFIVIEASSFQLEDTIKFKPHIALLTYVTSDHLDWHKTTENYVNAKFKIFANQDENDFAILNYEDRNLAKKYNIKAQKYYFSMEKISEKGSYFDDGKIYYNDGKNTEEILDVKDILAVGKVQYEDRMFFLDYQLSYTIVLASSRSMEPVELKESYPVTEVFMEGATNQLDQEVLDDDLVLPIENGEIDLSESVSDNILLNIPIKVLTAEEEAGQGFVSGNDWQIMTEEEYQAQQAVKKEENSPFAGLQGLFDGDE